MTINRYQAFSIHLLGSMGIGICSSALVFLVWYPAPLAEAVGVTDIFLMLLAVDVIIGPVITLFVFDTAKKELKRDLAIVLCLQITALLYGMHAVFIARPAFVVYNKDRFDVSRAHDIDVPSLEKAEKENNQAAVISWLQPKWVGAVAAKDNKRRQDIMFSSAMGGPDWPQLPELFVPLSDVKEQMLHRSKALSELRNLHEKEMDIINELANWNDTDVRWLPLKAPIKDGVVLINAKTAEVITALDIKPWP